ncbi:hypothetical protein LTR84_005808 [Exophiala bonariae]|uniref:Uncharacterized protein n=1 Tax=Exophiala bonariae TaxID=1690606 RepID=A0AAV9N3B5_9EURO|nr:hypothetical protein LTR84_005808 [Exophiala bonariae]
MAIMRKRRPRAIDATTRTDHAVSDRLRPLDDLPEPPQRLSRPLEHGNDSEASVNLARATASLPQDALSELFGSSGVTGLPVFEHVTGDGGIGLSHDFVGFDSMMTEFNAREQHATTEQLLAFESVPSAGAVIGSQSPSSLRKEGSKGSDGRIFGVDTLLRPASSSRAMSAGIFNRKDSGNSQFLGSLSQPRPVAISNVHRLHFHGGRRCPLRS